MSRGGSRPGAGRKPSGLPPTSKVVRVASEYHHFVALLPDLIEVLAHFDGQISDSSGPRWDQARRLIDEINFVFPFRGVQNGDD